MKLTQVFYAVLIGVLLAGGAIAYNTSNYTEQGGATTVIGGALNIASGGTQTVQSGGTLSVASGATFSSSGTMTLTGGATIPNTATLTVASGGTLSIAAGGSLSSSGTVTLTGGATVPLGATMTYASGSTASFASGSSLTIASGATLSVKGTTVNATGAELNLLDNQLATITAVSSGTSLGDTYHRITVTFKDAAGAALQTNGCADAIWSSDSTGTRDTVSAITTVTATGQVMTYGTSATDALYGLYKLCWPAASGTVTMDVQESGALTRYLVVVLPSGTMAASNAIVY